MTRRWMKEFRKANGRRLEQLHKRFSGDPTYDPSAYEAARAEIDELQRPEAEAIEAYHRAKIARIDALLAELAEATAETRRLLGKEP